MRPNDSASVSPQCMLPAMKSGSLERLQLFPSVVIKYVWTGSAELNHELIDLILSKEKTEPGISTSNVGGWHSNKDFQNWDQQCVSTLVMRMKALGMAMLRPSPGSDLDSESLEVQAWANVSRRGDFNRLHHHIRNSNLLSGIYYVTTGMSDGDTGPAANTIFEDQYRPKALDTADFGGYAVEPQAGLMVVFPSSLAHAVEPHNGNAARITVAFNLKSRQLTTLNYEMKRET